jgi:hypothetical protein
MEACATAHFWARELRSLGHDVRLMPPQYVKAYVKRGKNDAADAAAICEAVTRPSMRFVPVKTDEQQSALTMHRVRELLVRQRTQLINAVRGHLAEFSLVGAQGPGACLCSWRPCRRIGACRSWPDKSSRLLAAQLDEVGKRTRQLCKLFTTTGRYHPDRTTWAMPCASFASVLLTCSESAAATCLAWGRPEHAGCATARSPVARLHAEPSRLGCMEIPASKTEHHRPMEQHRRSAPRFICSTTI